MLKVMGKLIQMQHPEYYRKILKRQPASAPVLVKRHSFDAPINPDDLTISRGFVGLTVVPGDH
jgi:hypothetical protein